MEKKYYDQWEKYHEAVFKRYPFPWALLPIFTGCLGISVNLIIPVSPGLPIVNGIISILAYAAGVTTYFHQAETLFKMLSSIAAPLYLINVIHIIYIVWNYPEFNWYPLMMIWGPFSFGAGCITFNFIVRTREDSLAEKLQKIAAFFSLIFLWIGPTTITSLVFIFGPDIVTEVLALSLLQYLVIVIYIILSKMLDRINLIPDPFSFATFKQSSTFFYIFPPWYLTNLLPTWIKPSVFPIPIHLAAYFPIILMIMGSFTLGQCWKKCERESDKLLRKEPHKPYSIIVEDEELSDEEERLII